MCNSVSGYQPGSDANIKEKKSKMSFFVVVVVGVRLFLVFPLATLLYPKFFLVSFLQFSSLFSFIDSVFLLSFTFCCLTSFCFFLKEKRFFHAFDVTYVLVKDIMSK